MVKSSPLLIVLLLGLMFQTTAAQSSTPFSINNSPLPAPKGFVNDYAGVIDAGTKQRLENRLKNFKEQSNPSVEIAVAVVGTTGDRPIFDYSLAVARGWGIGSKSADNPSALLFIAINDRKYFTQVSRDLEDELPDGLAGSLQRQYLVPEFKKGNYSQGIEDTIEAYIRTIEAKQRGEDVAAPTPTPGSEKDFADKIFDAVPNWVCRGICILVIIIFIISVFSGRGGGGGRGGRGRRGGGGGGGEIAGAILGAILSGAANSGGRSSGGWSGGSDWGGGSSSGGGWGGFGGGGDFGGGGAGGSW
ncbi:MAG: TPM domain-containing protein [Pyrinomonadaceae bacterium]